MFMALTFAVQVWGASSIRCHLFLQIANFLLGHGEWDVSHAQRNKSASWPKVMSPAQCVKVRADNKLGLRLMEAAGAGLQQLITSLFLSEGGICLMVGSSRIIGSLNVKVGITNLWGEKASCAHELFHCQGIVNTDNFPLFYWESMKQQVVKSFPPEMITVLVSKQEQVSHFNDTNHMLLWLSKTYNTNYVKNRCPSCGCSDKLTQNITCWCWDSGFSTMVSKYSKLVADMDQWLWE